MDKITEQFRTWLGDFPANQKKDKKNELAKYCSVSITTINFWHCGRTKIKPAQQRLINLYAQKEIFDI